MDKILTLGAGFLAAIIVVILEGAGVNIFIRMGILSVIIYLLIRGE